MSPHGIHAPLSLTRLGASDSDNVIPSVQEVLSQSKRPEVGRFLLQVDRQTKRSYATAEAAEAAGMVIKKNHPLVRVSVYDSVETANKIIELPAGSSPTS